MGEFDWTQMEKEAQGIAKRVTARASYRNLDQPSFIGKPVRQSGSLAK